MEAMKEDNQDKNCVYFTRLERPQMNCNTWLYFLPMTELLRMESALFFESFQAVKMYDYDWKNNEYELLDKDNVGYEVSRKFHSSNPPNLLTDFEGVEKICKLLFRSYTLSLVHSEFEIKIFFEINPFLIIESSSGCLGIHKEIRKETPDIDVMKEKVGQRENGMFDRLPKEIFELIITYTYLDPIFLLPSSSVCILWNISLRKFVQKFDYHFVNKLVNRRGFTFWETRLYIEKFINLTSLDLRPTYESIEDFLYIYLIIHFFEN